MSEALQTVYGDLPSMPFIRATIVIDRQNARTFLKAILRVESDDPGWMTTVKTLQSLLARRDWKKISVSAESVDQLRRFGASFGIVEETCRRATPPLTPLQKWQRKHKLRGHK